MEGEKSEPRVCGRTIRLEYQDSPKPVTSDWICNHCRKDNFARRVDCFSCGAPREESCQTIDRPLDGDDGPPASSTVLIARGLSTDTTEATLHASFACIADRQNLQCIRLIKDWDTGVSRGFAFLEFTGVAAAARVVELFNQLAPSMVIDQRAVTLGYAKSKDSQLGSAGIPQRKSTAANAAIAAAMGAMASAGAGATAYAAPVKPKPVAVPKPKPAPERPPGVPEGLAYDENTGHWYDPTTQYYWDATHGCYYDGVAQQYKYWDVEQGVFIDWPPLDPIEDAKQKAKKLKALEAKKIAKDMERWQKQEKKRKKKDVGVKPAGGFVPMGMGQQTVQQMPEGQPQVAVDVAQPAVAPNEAGGPATVAAPAAAAEVYDTELDIDLPQDAELLARFSAADVDAWDAALQRGHVNVEENTCLLCQRKQKEGKLEKHVRKSALHLEALENARASILGSLSKQQLLLFETAVREASYRDRAAERRTKFGVSKKDIQSINSQGRKRNRPEPAPVKAEQPDRVRVGSPLRYSSYAKRFGGLSALCQLMPRASSCVVLV